LLSGLSSFDLLSSGLSDSPPRPIAEVSARSNAAFDRAIIALQLGPVGGRPRTRMSLVGKGGPAGRFSRSGPLDLAVEDFDSTLLLRVGGDLDLATVGQVTTALDQLELERPTLLVLDLQELAFLDLAGLRTILRANEHCKKHEVRFTVIKPRGLASRIFTLTSVHRELDLVDSRALGHGIDTVGRRAQRPERST
jgi:anti-anti-sigma factor